MIMELACARGDPHTALLQSEGGRGMDGAVQAAEGAVDLVTVRPTVTPTMVLLVIPTMVLLGLSYPLLSSSPTRPLGHLVCSVY